MRASLRQATAVTLTLLLVPGAATAQLKDRLRDAAKQAASDALYRTAARLFGLKDPVAERKMTAADLQSAATARAIFEKHYAAAAAACYEPSNVEHSEVQIEHLRDVVRRAAKKKALNDADLIALGSAFLPFVRYYAGRGMDEPIAISVPPGALRRVTIQTYCMDRDAPAPRSDEAIHLVPSSRLIPAHGKDLYAALMAHSAGNPSNHAAVQNLVWGMRHARAAAPHISVLALDQVTLLNRAAPSGALSFQGYLAKEMVKGRLDTIKVQLYQHALQRLERATGTTLPPPSSSGHSVADVETVLRLLELAPVTDGALEPNGNYTLIAPGVAVRAVPGTVGVRQTQFEVVNASCEPYSWRLDDFVGQSTRVTQRLALGGVVASSPAEELQPVLDGVGQSDLKALRAKLTAADAAIPVSAASVSAVVADGVWSRTEVEILRLLAAVTDSVLRVGVRAAGVLTPVFILCWPRPAGEGSDIVRPSDNPIAWPGYDGTKPPPEFDQWRGNVNDPEGTSGKGAWVNPDTGESWSPDLNHPQPKGPHWTYNDGKGNMWDVFPDGTTKKRGKDDKKKDDKKDDKKKD